MANHGAAALILIASSLLVASVALSGADARLTAVRRDANGGYVLEEKIQEIACSNVIGVEQGQTCSSIALGAGLSQDDFLAFNPNINCDHIFVGQWVCLLAKGA